ncbi:MAG: hypothetical protein M0Z59_06095 [Nitrospiraceae bacterium]|nr:hypothetical protein [Nitrospiraceae bacterium]
MKKKMNCWELKNCGRQPGGENISGEGVCPASTENRLDGVHGGMNAGRTCWVVAGTLSWEEVYGTFARKYCTCEMCEVYSSIKKEEKRKFKLSSTLLTLLGK